MKKYFTVFAFPLAFLLFLLLSGCITPPACGNGICETGESDSRLPTYCPQDCEQINCNSDADCKPGTSYQTCDGSDLVEVSYPAVCRNPGLHTSYCDVQEQRTVLESCKYGCENAQCIEIACAQDSDCGIDGPTGDPYCDYAPGGLVGSYYDNKDFTSLKLTRLDSNVFFDWKTGSPSPLIAADTFSVKWDGNILAKIDADYNFFISSDDGSRLYIDGTLLIDNWGDHGPIEKSKTVFLSQGLHGMTVKYYENTVGAAVWLSWSFVGQSKAMIPSDSLYHDASKQDMVKYTCLNPGLPESECTKTTTASGTDCLYGCKSGVCS